MEAALEEEGIEWERVNAEATPLLPNDLAVTITNEIKREFLRFNRNIIECYVCRLYKDLGTQRLGRNRTVCSDAETPPTDRGFRI